MVSYEEIELTLALCSDTPDLIAEEIAELGAIGSYRLRPRPDIAIHDVYFDLADRALDAHKLGMRVRFVGGCQLITLKGGAKAVPGGGKRREEIERDWSVDALTVVVARIADHGINLVVPRKTVQMADPLTVLTQMGFVVEQVRDTLRRPRDVILTEGSSLAVAELAVDSVAFQFPSGEVRHHEVEIEVKGEGGVVAMQEVSGELLARWPITLRLWDHGKRPTGKAAAALLGERGRVGLLNDSGDLTPEAYDLIASRLG